MEETAAPLPRNWGVISELTGLIKLWVARRFWGIDIGSGTRVHPSALLDRTWPVGLHIGCDCVVDRHAAILTHDYTRGILTDTHIGDGARIGARAIVMPGLSIGRNAIIYPGAIVTRDVADGQAVMGNPAVPVER